jgi:hypothetical protein
MSADLKRMTNEGIVCRICECTYSWYYCLVGWITLLMFVVEHGTVYIQIRDTGKLLNSRDKNKLRRIMIDYSIKLG